MKYDMMEVVNDNWLSLLVELHVYFSTREIVVGRLIKI
jgi:hypothetical protein